VDFPNKDPFFHNVFSLFDGKRFDLGLYEAGSTKSVTFSREGVSYMAAQGVTDFYEVGAGKVLSGLIKRIADGATGTAIGTPEDIGAFVTARGGVSV
jgi:hypothetical protein